MGGLYAYDNLLGRRIATHRAQASCTAPCSLPEDLFADNKYATHHFDYYGLSQRVAVERISPWEGDESAPPVHADDKFVESYTYGPVGVTRRTVETDDADPGDNFDHWVLPDVFGGAAGLLLYDAQPGQRAAVFEHFDAFGVRVATTGGWGGDEDASRYRWRSQEGSETDDLAVSDNYGAGLQPPTLVYMQTRHYDPGLGRFIMANSIPMGAFSPQGLNRYAYCTNDPVNLSDEKGTFTLAAFLLLALIAVALGLGLTLFGGLVLLLMVLHKEACFLVGGEDAYEAYIDWFATKLNNVSWGEILTDLALNLLLAVLVVLGVISGGLNSSP